MKTIIAGSRTVLSYAEVERAIDASGFEITEVVSGGAAGVDSLGELWAKENGIEVVTFPAYWNVYGKSAGIRRNVQMAKYAEALIAVWDGKSKGTRHMINCADKHGLKVYIWRSM